MAATTEPRPATRTRGSLPVFYDPPVELEPDTESSAPRMGLPRRLAFLTAIMAILLVLGATEIALSWSARTRLEDFRLESVALANTLASLLMRAAPTGNAESLAQTMEGWSRHRITESQATVYVLQHNAMTPVASSGNRLSTPADQMAFDALHRRTTEVRLLGGDDPGWRVLVPLGATRPYGVLDVRVSTRRLQDWA